MRTDVLAIGAALALASVHATRPEDGPPDAIVLVMTDDQGWGDVGLRDASLHTPALDALLKDGIELRRFYAAAPVCSPTRASVLTGRHPARQSIDGANDGHLLPRELHLGELLRAAGYRTGFFGKWHLGTLTRDVRDSNRGGRLEQVAHHSPPWEHGFDVTFATEAKVPTFDPMKKPGSDEPYGTRYWTGPGQVVAADQLEGDDSRLVVDRALAFLDECAQRGVPSFAVVWLHAPHEPVVESPERLKEHGLDAASRRDRYVACLADVDAQVGALRAALEEHGRGLLWFCSDNGPEHARGPGSTGGLRGRKRDLLEGGIRVPAALWWCGQELEGVATGRPFDGPAGTVDVLPTVLEVTGVPATISGLDGSSLLPRLRGSDVTPGYGFRSRKKRAWIEGRWKAHSRDAGATWALYDVAADPGEANDLAREHVDVLERLRTSFTAWEADVLRDRERVDSSGR